MSGDPDDRGHWLADMPEDTVIGLACAEIDLPEGVRLHVTLELAHPPGWRPPGYGVRPIGSSLERIVGALWQRHVRGREEAMIEGEP